MRNIEVITTQNVAIQYEYAPAMNRLAAFAIDLLIITSICYGIGATLISEIPFIGYLIGPFFFLYFLISEIVTDGQSIGKKALDLKIIRISGKQPEMGDYVIRWLFSIVDYFMTFGILAFFLIKTTQKNQRLGDMIAGTTVIRMKPNLALDYKDLMKIQDISDYLPTYSQVVHFNERQVLLMKKTLDIYRKYPNGANRSAMKKLFDKVTVQVTPKKPIERVSQIESFIEILIKDYIVLSR